MASSDSANEASASAFSKPAVAAATNSDDVIVPKPRGAPARAPRQVPKRAMAGGAFEPDAKRARPAAAATVSAFTAASSAGAIAASAVAAAAVPAPRVAGVAQPSIGWGAAPASVYSPVLVPGVPLPPGLPVPPRVAASSAAMWAGVAPFPSLPAAAVAVPLSSQQQQQQQLMLMQQMQAFYDQQQRQLMQQLQQAQQQQQQRQPVQASRRASAPHRKQGVTSDDFKCEVCGRQLCGHFSLMRHMRLHTGDKPFKCEECGKAFRQRGTLSTHMRLHTGAASYECARCGATFRHRSSLRRHEGHAHGIEEKPAAADAGHSPASPSSTA